MIVIDNVKYACQKCIKGHRSSRCDHTERHLVIVKRKGRPISQCDECREQRLKRHIHQKCVCPKLSGKKKYLTNTTSNATKTLNTSRHIMSIEALLLS
ncbi:copper fist DNA-binding transcription factor [Mucor lusitanicus]|uniref:Copper fist DNA-binding transcription factor n=2 Tax=Mucor circinelloides f. lusitanicus TaxID=29924 RepID=A0A168HVC8_MUCCL|nr:copper fist DNA-binding transcription factor [Mucor lusitanicus]OAC99230.1 copper fist DNA-binding transcription factor [Mucor lusitanicus CBS 277.49]